MKMISDKDDFGGNDRLKMENGGVNELSVSEIQSPFLMRWHL